MEFGRRADVVAVGKPGALVPGEADDGVAAEIQDKAADNIKGVVSRVDTKWSSDASQHPYLIQDTQEVKTTWHPIGS